MKLDTAMTRADILDLNAKVRDRVLDVMENAYFVGRVIDARTGEIIPVGADEFYNVHLLPNK